MNATYQYGTYVHQDGTNVPHVLMLYGDDCNSQLAHAHQSSYRPSSQVHSLGGDPKTVSALDLVIKTTVATVFEVSPTQRKRVVQDLQSRRTDPLWNLRSERLVPLRLSEHAKQELNKLTDETELKHRGLFLTLKDPDYNLIVHSVNPWPRQLLSRLSGFELGMGGRHLFAQHQD